MAQATLSCRFAAIHLVAPAPRFWRRPKRLYGAKAPPAQKGRWAVFLLAAPKQRISILIVPAKKKDMTAGHVLLFGFRRPEGGSTLRYFNARGRQSRPISAPSAALRAVALRNAAAAAVHDFRPQAGNLPAARRSGRIWKAACPRRRGTFCRHRIKGGIRFCRMPPFAHGFSLRGGRPRDTAVRAPSCPPRPGPPPGSMCR